MFFYYIAPFFIFGSLPFAQANPVSAPDVLQRASIGTCQATGDEKDYLSHRDWKITLPGSDWPKHTSESLAALDEFDQALTRVCDITYQGAEVDGTKDGTDITFHTKATCPGTAITNALGKAIAGLDLPCSPSENMLPTGFLYPPGLKKPVLEKDSDCPICLQTALYLEPSTAPFVNESTVWKLPPNAAVSAAECKCKDNYHAHCLQQWWWDHPTVCKHPKY